VFVEPRLDLNCEAVCEAIRRICRRLSNQPCPAEEMVANDERHGLAVRASILRSRINSL
jgi:hypothetical protein